ncbi:saposin A [Heterostelium album PN500]|uniref:Saposin A n=1 Tax=Heterostelium pallidum (strain ATCC 26659 / Pp 5 / PN500) TaxID=670386 RepID=D3BEG8_HETP5|nr:saposin A [Heterostelium album PN500]EFA80299.1 saposin A [Heterostelium album PN500]|eukprot:XP_020432419.1 saposin A [Heterostelium album PN500]
MKIQFVLFSVFLLILISNVNSKQINEKGNNVTCEACELVVSYVERFLEQNKTINEIEQELEKVCLYLPGVWSSNCKIIVQNYITQIIDMIINEEDPDQICSILGVCTNEVMVMVMQPVVKIISNTECPICTIVTGYVEQFVDRNSSVQEMVSALEKICSKFDQGWASQCNSLVSNYVPIIIELLAKEMTPAIICQEMKLCPVPGQVRQSMNIIASQPTENKNNQLAIVPDHNSLLIAKRNPTARPVVNNNNNACDNEPNPDQVCGMIGLCSTHRNPFYNRQNSINIKI